MRDKKSKRKRSELELINIKISPKDRKALKAQAKKFANGNLSAWLRFTGLHYKPVKPLDII